MPMYIWEHSQTKERKEVFALIKDIDEFLNTVEDPENWRRLMFAPRIMEKTYLDGQRAKSDPVYQDLKEIADLKVQQAECMFDNQKIEIQKEIDTINKR